MSEPTVLDRIMSSWAGASGYEYEDQERLVDTPMMLAATAWSHLDTGTAFSDQALFKSGRRASEFRALFKLFVMRASVKADWKADELSMLTVFLRPFAEGLETLDGTALLEHCLQLVPNVIAACLVIAKAMDWQVKHDPIRSLLYTDTAAKFSNTATVAADWLNFKVQTPLPVRYSVHT